MCNTVEQSGINIKWQHLIFHFIIYIVKLYQDCFKFTDMLGCQAVALYSAEEIVFQ